MRGTMLAIKYMGAPNGGKGGTVVQTASIAAFFPNFYFAAMYMSSKRAVVDYTRAIGVSNCRLYVGLSLNLYDLFVVLRIFKSF